LTRVKTPVLLIGCGSSLSGFDFERLRGLGTIIGVKEAIWSIPTLATCCFGLDYPWMCRQAAALSTLKLPVYLAITGKWQSPPKISNAIFLERIRSKVTRLSTDPTKIECGRNSGFGALNLALHFGAKLIYLFGFDYGTAVYCPERYAHKRKESGNHWPTWAKQFDCVKDQLIEAGVTVINASPNSSITAFPKVTIEQAMSELKLIKLTAPNGDIVEKNPGSIVEMYPNVGDYHPNAKTVINLGNGVVQAVKEDQVAIGALINPPVKPDILKEYGDFSAIGALINPKQ
jgi:hypothetical protein